MPKTYGLNVYMNNGRWLIHCPRCRSGLPALESGVVCPRCWPGILAKAFRQLPNGLLRPVPDTELVEVERAKAQERGELYIPVFPKEKAQIEQILKLRPYLQNINWEPGETIEMLKQQNLAHGDPVPEEEKENK